MNLVQFRRRNTIMPAVAEVMTMVKNLNEQELEELFRLIEEMDSWQWYKEREEATRAFHAAGLTDDDIDEAVRKLRHEGRS
jgi:hypothetical protein